MLGVLIVVVKDIVTPTRWGHPYYIWLSASNISVIPVTSQLYISTAVHFATLLHPGENRFQTVNYIYQCNRISQKVAITREDGGSVTWIISYTQSSLTETSRAFPGAVIYEPSHRYTYIYIALHYQAIH